MPKPKRPAFTQIGAAGKMTRMLAASAKAARAGGKVVFLVRDRADANHWLHRLRSAALAEGCKFENHGRVVVYPNGGTLTFDWNER